MFCYLTEAIVPATTPTAIRAKAVPPMAVKINLRLLLRCSSSKEYVVYLLQLFENLKV